MFLLITMIFNFFKSPPNYSLNAHQGLVKKVVEKKAEFVGIDLENPDYVVIDVDDAEKLAKIVSMLLVPTLLH